MSSEDESLSKPEKRGLFSRWRRKGKTEGADKTETSTVAESAPTESDELPVDDAKPDDTGDVQEVVQEDNTNSLVETESVDGRPQYLDVDTVTQDPEKLDSAALDDTPPPADRALEDTFETKVDDAPALDDEPEPAIEAAREKPRKKKKANIFSRALSRTSSGLGSLFLGRKAIDDDLFEELETLLLMADVGVDVTTTVIDELTARVKRGDLNDSDALKAELHEVLLDIVADCEKPLVIEDHKPFVLLVVGVNGVGKTTTIGKLAQRFQQEGKSVMLAAGDTFRAAAVEQLQVWGERNNVPVIAQHTGADSASVIFDAIDSAKAKGTDVLIADTAGRLHTKSNLMDELEKIKRVMAKRDESAPHEILLVLDAGTGQNALNQMHEFNQTVGVTGIALTKLDGTAKGGVVFALCQRFGVPLRYVGLGEGVDDLQVFRAEDYVKAVLSEPDEE